MVSASLLGLGFILTITLLPSRRRLEELRAAEAAVPAPAPHPEPKAIPVALCCCSPVITQLPAATPAR